MAAFSAVSPRSGDIQYRAAWPENKQFRRVPCTGSVAAMPATDVPHPDPSQFRTPWPDIGSERELLESRVDGPAEAEHDGQDELIVAAAKSEDREQERREEDL